MYKLTILHNGTPREVIEYLRLEQIVPLEAVLRRYGVKYTVAESAQQQGGQGCTCAEPWRVPASNWCSRCNQVIRR
jgi:hypothetical protein